MKAMLLAAGAGERMLPLTRTLPKPLVPVLGRPMAPQILAKLASEGIEEAVVNLHHLPGRIRQSLGDGSSLGLEALHFSDESERLLGTGGGLAAAARWLRGSGTILVRNADFLADIPLAKALASHIRSACPATLVLVPHRAGYTTVEIDASHRVVAFGGADGKTTAQPERFLFTGYHLIEEAILDAVPAGTPCDIVKEVYIRLARERRLNAHVHRGFWWEFGTPRQYLEGSMRLISTDRSRRARLGDFDPVKTVDAAEVALGPGADLAERLALKGALAIGLGVMVAERASLEDSVVMPESWIGPGSSLRRCIVGPGTEIPVGFEADNAIIVASDSAGPLPAGAERIANLIVRRFDDATAA